MFAVLIFQVYAITAAYAGLPDIIERVKPAIVGIGTYNATRGQPLMLEGTGFAVTDGQHIVTNYHVVSRILDDSRNERYVALTGQGKNVKAYTLVQVGLDTLHDLALLKFEGPALPALKINSNIRVREGQLYAFTGFPIGAVLGLYPVTHRGIVSAITPIAIPVNSDRELSTLHIRQLRDKTAYPVYQLDAVAYPGNSGSPLYDMETGAVIGVLNSVLVKNTRENVLENPSGISYAIPATHIERLLSRFSR